MMTPPIKFAMKSLAAKPKAKPPRPPKENKNEAGKPKVTRVAANVASNVIMVANRTKINFFPSSVCAELSGNIFVNNWLPYFDNHIDTISPAVKIYVPRSKPAATFSGTAKFTYIASTNSHVTSKTYPVIHKNIKAPSGFPIQCANVSRYGESKTSALSNCSITFSLFESSPLPPNAFILCFSNHKNISRLRFITNLNANIAHTSSKFHGSLIFRSIVSMVDFATSKEHFTAFFDCLRNSRTAVFVGSFRSPFAEGEAAAHAADGTKNPFSVNPRNPPKVAEKTNIIAGATIIFLMSIIFVVVVFIVVVFFFSSEEEEEDEEEEEERRTECRPFIIRC